jgi:hypothetical protein
VIKLAGRGNQYDVLRAESEAPSVMAAIRAYDPQLLVGWDSSACRWSLLRVSHGGYHFVGVLQNEEGGYRPLDMSILDDLRRRDMWRTSKSGSERAMQREAEIQAERDRLQASQDDDDNHNLRDNRRTLHRLARLVGL